jgi:osmotically-inducible protein OsmY
MHQERRRESIGREQDQYWNDRQRGREGQRGGEEERYGRAEYEQGYGARDFAERASFRPRESREDFERSRYGNGGGRDWRDSERSYGREGERQYGGEGNWGRQGGWGNEGQYGRESYGSEGRMGREGGMGRQDEVRSSSFGGRDSSWRYGGSAYEPYYRAGRNRSEGSGYERPEDRSSDGYRGDFRSVADYGSNQSFSGGTAGLGLGENRGETTGISGMSRGSRHGMDGSTSAMRRGQHAGKGPKDFRRSDERLREEVSERLMADPDIDASEITLNVKDGEVTLEGSVMDRQTKRDAEDCIENVMGVRQVNNRLRISDSGSRNASTNSSNDGGSQRGQQSGQQSNKSGQQSSQQSSEVRSSGTTAKS